ncbi:MAG: 50S ribosomal protein L7ae [Firmicutes bacterium HGW-Firmicutes-1]|jgi:ribosomal protein L7Ae-like RNA K-turn-binding protein|nr:MAG: 50S ribosomal protein L7ae [Firmicutes bacterium HGW-Firmicutes-1]
MNKVFPTLGLCMKAGLLAAGEFMVEKAIKDETVKLVIIAGDASDNTKKKFRNMCTFRNVEMIEFSDKYTLGKALGKEVRATIGILDVNFAKNIKSKIEEK